jgi:hypothetical protein
MRNRRGCLVTSGTRALVAVALITLASAASGPARAQSNDMPDPPPPVTDADRDRQFVQEMDQERARGAAGKGWVIVDAAMSRACSTVQIDVGRVVDGKFKGVGLRGTTKGLFGLSYGDLQALPSGEYIISALRCRMSNMINRYRGPHARFQVRAGEVVDVGTLNFENKRDGIFASTGVSTRSVGPANADRIAKLKERFPRTMVKVVSRPMTLIGPAETKTKQRGTLW